jgi:PqqD family protein of HPr-rel-A system
MVRFLVFIIVVLAGSGAWVMGTLATQHDGGWQAVAGGTGLLLRLCESQTMPSASCADVVGSRWGSFDFHVGSRVVNVPTSLIGLGWFVSVAIWFTMVGRVPAWSRRLWRFVLLLSLGSVVISVLFFVAMVFVVGGWCPLCALAHALNLGIFLALVTLRRVSRSRNVRRTAGGLTDPPAVARIQRRLSAAAFGTCCLACLAMWFYFDAVSEARRQWRKVFGMNQAVAALQEDRGFVLREYYAQPAVFIPPRSASASSQTTHPVADAAQIVMFVDYDCTGCACFEGRRERVFRDAFGENLRVEIRHLPLARPQERRTDNSASTVPDLPVSQAALAAEAARLQGGDTAFMRMHRLLFEHRRDQRGRDYSRLAREAGLDVSRFLADMESDAVRRTVQEDVAVARQLGLTEAPAVFLNSRRVPDLCVNSPVFWPAVADDASDVWDRAGISAATPTFLSGLPMDDAEAGDDAEDDVPEAPAPLLSSTSVDEISDTELVGPPGERRLEPQSSPADSLLRNTLFGEHDMDPLSNTLAPDCSPVERRPIRVDTVNVHELDGEALLFDPSTGDTHRLNETALFIWSRCDGSHGVAGIASALADAYEVSEDEARDHVQRIVQDFDERGLLVTDE